MPEVVPDEVELVAVSGLEGIQRDRVLRVGTFFNEFPFAWLSDTGEVTGYEADILRSIGIELGIAIDFVQVTRNNALESLLTGRVDADRAADPGRQPLRVGRLHAPVLPELRAHGRAPGQPLRRSGAARRPTGRRGNQHAQQRACATSASSGIAFDIRTYFSESDALDALANGEVEGMVGELDSLRRAGRQQMRLIDEPVMTEPYAIAVRRWDVNLRNLLNRSLQRLKASGRLDEIFDAWFPDDSIDFDILVPVYNALYADERGVDQFNADVPLPANPVMDRIASGQPIRVAGILETENPEAPAQIRITNALNRAIVEELARRWDAQIEFVPDSAHNAVDLVANGQADLAVGVSPRWDGADRLTIPCPTSNTATASWCRSDHRSKPSRTCWAPAGGSGTSPTMPPTREHTQDGRAFQRRPERPDVRYPARVRRDLHHDRRGQHSRHLRRQPAVAGAHAPSEDPASRCWTWYGDVLPIAFAVPRNDADFRH